MTPDVQDFIARLQHLASEQPHPQGDIILAAIAILVKTDERLSTQESKSIDLDARLKVLEP